jgi:hypothetical protein
VLTGNRISRVSESWLTLLPQLKSLKLNKNAFRSLVAFPCLPNLEFLDLSNNQISEVPGLIFKQLASLRVLKLHKNSLTKLHHGSFFIAKAGSTNLEKLHLEYNALTKIDTGAFFGLVSLKEM